jgi:glycosyltransferase involved in cell wall biosynthesis
VGGISDIIEHGINGFMVSESSPDFFAPLAELYENKPKRKIISEANREKSKAFSLERMTESYISLYNQYL